MVNAPIVTIQLEGMRHTIKHAMVQYMVEMDSDIQRAIDNAMTTENVQQLVQSQAKQEIESAIREEINKFFSYGGGRKIIGKTVRDLLEQRAKDMAGFDPS